MTSQLYRNLGNGRFDDVSSQSGPYFSVADVARGAAFGDLDNDGDTDVVIGTASGPLRLLVNQIGNMKHWIGLRLVGAARAKAPAHEESSRVALPQNIARGGSSDTPVRDMLGARVTIFTDGGRALWRRARSDGSYASANDSRVLAGLGSSTTAPGVRVRWPSGRTEEWSSVPVDRYTTLTEGRGTPAPERAR
jgi:hypothetical protein